MKILISTSYFEPYISGLTLTAQRLAEAWAERGHRVTVLTNRHEGGLKSVERGRYVIYRSSPNIRISKGFFSWEFVRLAYKLASENEWVLINLPQVEGVFVAGFAKLFKKKIISIYTCDLKLKNKWLELMVYFFNWMSLGLSDKVVTYTQDNANNMPILKMFRHKVTSIFPPIPDLIIDNKTVKMIRSKIGKSERVIGIAARLAEEKGIEYILQALPMLGKKTKLVIAGPTDPVGEGSYKTKIMNLVNHYYDQVIFLGSLKQNEMGAFYKCIDVLVVSSVNTTEAFGLVQIEAMKQGVPVVATNLPGVRIPVYETGTGTVVPVRDSCGLVEAIKKNINKKITNNKKFFEYFNQFRVAELYEKTFSEL